MFVPLVILVLGLGILTVGAELLVRGAKAIALQLGVSPLVVGLTIVAMGTSAPELAVSVFSAVRGQTDLALGNCVGSNIFNVLIIGGVSALVAPLLVNKRLVAFDVPVMIIVSLTLLGLSWDGRLGRGDGALLLLGFCGYNFFLLRNRRYTPSETLEGKKDPRALTINVVLLVLGLVGLVAGAYLFVEAAQVIARKIGLSELVIGLTIVAGGTSLPELATSVVATIRGERDIAIGNIVGSNIFNILGVLGVTAAIEPIPVSAQVLSFDLPVMLGVAIACLPVFYSRFTVDRWEAVIFLLAFVGYTIVLIGTSGAESAFQQQRFFFNFAGISALLLFALSCVRELSFSSQRVK